MKILLTIIGLAGVLLAGGKMFVWGDAAVNYGSYVPWGLWVAVYGFMVTLSAGSSLIAGFYYGFGREEYKEAARPALVLSIVSLFFAMPLISADLGHPLRGMMILVRPNVHAFLPWAVWAYIAFLIVSIIVLIRGDAGRDTRFLGIISMLLAGAFLLFESLHFAVVIAHPVWNSAIIIPLFFVTADTLGFAVLAIFGGTGNAFMNRTILSSLLILLGLMVIGQVIVHANSSPPELHESALHAVSSPWFWTYIALGLVLPLLLLCSSRSSFTMKLSGWSILIGLLAEKYEFVTSAFALAQFAELPSAFHGPGLTVHYTPNIIEIGAAAGFLILTMAAYMWLSPRRKRQGGTA
ncbi:MAG TPA: hypothetical protein ENI89_13475 [Desulfobulbus sp.]|nr:hypothetical protein [Desulfobulbus sp.]